MVESLFAETQLLAQTLKEWMESLHSGLDITLGMRAVLELLLRDGAMSVPDAARARLVSRQNIQQQVDALLDRKLVRRVRNPAHKSSFLIALTDVGRALIENMRADERNALLRLQAGTSDHAIHDATQVVHAWREALADDARRRAQ